LHSGAKLTLIKYNILAISFGLKIIPAAIEKKKLNVRVAKVLIYKEFQGFLPESGNEKTEIFVGL